ILANTVLPFGFSRMVTETLGDPKALEETGFLQAIRPELVAPIVVYLASRACEFSHRNYSAFGGRFARVFVGLGEGWLAEPGHDPAGGRGRGRPRGDLGDRAVHGAGVDLRRGLRRVRAARCRPHLIRSLTKNLFRTIVGAYCEDKAVVGMDPSLPAE